MRAGLVERARRRGIRAVTLVAGSDLAALARDAVAQGADALGVAGGDGTLAVVAAVAGAAELPFVCVPAGTRNHFARDLGVDPRELPSALDAFSQGLERRIDVGAVNGRLFLNNVSLGVYGDAVHRAAYRDAKARTLLDTAREVIGPTRTATGLRIVDDLGQEHRDPAVVLVSNNPYVLDGTMARGRRAGLDSGRLGVLVLDAPAPLPHRPARVWTASSVEIGGPVRVHAGLDGESVQLTPPLRCTISPAALRVRIPSNARAPSGG